MSDPKLSISLCKFINEALPIYLPQACKISSVPGRADDQLFRSLIFTVFYFLSLIINQLTTVQYYLDYLILQYSNVSDQCLCSVDVAL